MITLLAAGAPHAPAATDVLAEVLLRLSIAVAVGTGLTLAVLAPTDVPGGIAQRTRVLLPWFAALAVIGGVAQVITAGPKDHGTAVTQLVLLLLTAALMLAARVRTGRTLHTTILLSALVTAVVPFVPTAVPNLDTASNVNTVAKDVLTAGHVIGAFTWLGGVAVLAVVGLRQRSAASPSGEWARVWARFSAIMLYSVGLLLLTGTWLAWTHVGTVGQFFSTAYGRYLGIKLIMVAAMLVCGALNMTVLVPRLGAETPGVAATAARRLPVTVTVEAILGIGVLTVVPFLAGSARAQAGWAPARTFDLTVFGTGALLAGLIAAALWAGSRVRLPSPAPVH
jgi:putative copper export protein